MNYFELKDTFRLEVDDQSGNLVHEKELDIWFEQAIRQVWRSYLWPWTMSSEEVTVNGSLSTVTLSADVLRITHVEHKTDDRERLRRDYKSRLTGLLSSKGKPLYYSSEEYSQATQTAAPRRRLSVYPTPDSSYTLIVYYQRKPPIPDADDDHIPFPEDFNEVLRHWAKVRFYRKIDDLHQAHEWQEEFDAEIQRLLFDMDDADDFPRIIPSSDSYFLDEENYV